MALDLVPCLNINCDKMIEIEDEYCSVECQNDDVPCELCDEHGCSCTRWDYYADLEDKFLAVR